MDFLESAVVLVPALIGINITVYRGEPDILEEFATQYCLFADIQKIYTAMGMQSFLRKGIEKFIYEIVEPMGSHIIMFRNNDLWVILGPYVEEEWKSDLAKCLLKELDIPQAAIRPYMSYYRQFPLLKSGQPMKAARMILDHMDEGKGPREVKVLKKNRESCQPAPCFFNDYQDIRMINRRYMLEERFVEAVSLGEASKAKDIMIELEGVRSDLRSQDELRDRMIRSYIFQTLVRIGGRKAGLSPVIVDSINHEYSWKIYNQVSPIKVDDLVLSLVDDICREVRKLKSDGYSVYVRKAVDYIRVNLDQPITITKLSAAVGINQTRFVKIFCRETGMTMKQYIAKKRCDIAAELLLDSELSIQEISASVGYGDNNYFSKVFKANKGISPQDYRIFHWISV